MSNSRAALRYAKASLAQATDKNEVDAVATDMSAIAETIVGDATLKAVLVNPVIPTDKKAAVITALFPKAAKTTLATVQLLAENKRFDVLQEVALAYSTLYNESQGLIDAVVTTAAAIDKGAGVRF